MAETVTVEGSTLNETLANAVAALSATSPDELEWDYVRKHFSKGAWTVLLTAHLRTEEELAAVRERQAAARERNAANEEANRGAQDLADNGGRWMRGMMDAMGIECEIMSHVRNGEPGLTVSSAEDGRLLVGKEGKNIKALEALLHASVGVMRLDIADTRSREDRPRRDDDDRGPRRGGRDGEQRTQRRGGREGDGPTDRGARRGGRDDAPPREKDPARDAKLVEQATEFAKAVLEGGDSKTLDDLNSYERHLVHTAVREVEGVVSRSVGRGRVRGVEIAVAGDDGDDG